MRIASFNINGVKARLPRLIEWLQERRPAAACLQEIKCQDESFPAADFAAIGYHAIWHGQKGFNGVAILTDGEPPVEARRGLPGDPDDEQARYIEADFGGVRIVNLYLPNGNPQPGPKFDYKLAWMDRLAERAQALLNADRPFVITGDFNVCPTDEDYAPGALSPIDALVRPESRAAYRRMIWMGLTDAVRAVHPHAPVYTFWDYQGGAWQRDMGLRIDHALLSPTLAERLISADPDRNERDQPQPSDHVPVVTTLN